MCTHLERRVPLDDFLAASAQFGLFLTNVATALAKPLESTAAKITTSENAASPP
jgi:hypothetical protein